MVIPMTDRPAKLNPPTTPMCREEHNLFCLWIATPEALKNDRIRALGELMSHRAACPVCRARFNEINELAQVAEEPKEVEG